MFLNTKNKRTTIPAKIELPATAQTTDSTISASKKVHLQGGIRQYNDTSLDTLATRSMTREYVLILVLVEHTLGEQLLQRTLFQSITLVNSEYLSVFNR